MGIGVSVRQFYTPYPDQEDAVAAAIKSTKPCIAIIGPPGSGKSMVNLLLAEQYPKSAILCVTKQLQKQYEDYGLEDVALVMGKNNYPCPMGYSVNCEKSDEKNLCKKCMLKESLECDYWKAEADADASPIAVTNYAYYFMQVYYGQALHNRHSVIFDEAHEFDKTILGLMDVEFRRPYDEPRLGVKLPRDFNRQSWREVKAIADTRLGWDKEALNLKTQFAITEIAFANPDAWIFEQQGDIITIRPKWVDPIWTKPLIENAHKVVLSSATFYPPYVGSLLGFAEEDIEVIEMPSTFPKEYRPFIFKPVARVSTHKGTEEESAELDKLVLEIDKMLADHPNDKGLIHTVSYKLRDVILQRTRFPERFMTHESSTRNKAIEQFRRAPAGKVMASPSMTTGVDLPYEQCAFQIIAKLPVPSLGDSRVVARKNERKEVHDAEVANTLVQMYGRAMRGADDFGITYCLDVWGKYFYEGHRGLFPKYVQEAVVML